MLYNLIYYTFSNTISFSFPANGPSTSNVAPNIFESAKGNPVKASKTYQATKRTRRIVSDLTTDDIVDEI